MSSKDQFAGLAVQEAAGSALIESTADVLQNAVVRHDHHTLSPLPSHYFLHTRQSSHGSIEASLTVLQGGREDLVQNVQVSMSVLFFLRYIFDMFLVYKGVLPFALIRDELLLHEPIHLTEIIVLVMLLLLGKTTCKVTYFGQHLRQFRQHHHSLDFEVIDLDEEIGSLQGSVHRGDKDNIDVPAACEVLFGKGGFGALLPAFLTEPTVDVRLVEMHLGEWLFTVQKIFVVMCISVEL